MKNEIILRGCMLSPCSCSSFMLPLLFCNFLLFRFFFPIFPHLFPSVMEWPFFSTYTKAQPEILQVSEPLGCLLRSWNLQMATFSIVVRSYCNALGPEYLKTLQEKTTKCFLQVCSFDKIIILCLLFLVIVITVL